MLDEKDLQSIQTMIDASIRASENRMIAYFDTDVMPKFDLLAEGQKNILETLAPKSRVEELEDEVKFLKSMIRRINEDVQKLQKAN